jgi:hypothetical protein
MIREALQPCREMLACPPAHVEEHACLQREGMAAFPRMSDKDVVIETIRRMPEVATLEQISEEIAILAAIRKGEEAADAGRVTPHEEVRQKLASWISK